MNVHEVFEAPVLFGVAKVEFDLKAQAVVIDKPVVSQIKIAAEETKFGWNFEELNNILLSEKQLACPDVIICGVMGMASLTDDLIQVRNEMKSLKASFDHLKDYHFKNDPIFDTISMGMSGDYNIALEEGSKMIRIGSLLFS